MGRATKTFICLAVCLFSSNAQPVKEQLTIEEYPGYQVNFKDSEPIQLPCKISSSSSNVEYSWQKDGKPVAYEHTPEGLLIPNPTAEDEGNYQCFVKSNQGTASSSIWKLKRKYVKLPAGEIIKAKYTPEEGKPFKLDCPIPEGYPKPVIVWTYDQTSKRITQGPDGALYFSNVTKEDANNSKYVCDAISEAQNERINLREYELEGVKENKEQSGELVPQFLSQELTVEAGFTSMLYCIYGGTPLAYPDWFFKGKNVNGKPGDRVTHRNRTGGKRLLIKDTLYSDQGTYTCEASNEVGKPQKHTIKLNIFGGPNYLPKLEKVVSTSAGKDVTIDCKVEGFPAPRISWTYNAQPLKESDTINISNGLSEKTTTSSKLIIKNAQKSNVGYYGCKAENEHGQSYSESLVVIS